MIYVYLFSVVENTEGNVTTVCLVVKWIRASLAGSVRTIARMSKINLMEMLF